MNGLKVLFHINELSRWQIVLEYLTNFLNDVGQDNANTEVVINGEAVSILNINVSKLRMAVCAMDQLMDRFRNRWRNYQRWE